MVRPLVPLILIAAFLISACESTPQRDADVNDTTATATPPDGQDSAPEDTEGAEDGPGLSLPAILDRAFQSDPQTQELTLLDDLNEPNNVTSESQRNRHDPNQTDTLRTLQYNGLSLTVYHVSDGKEILESVTVTGDQYETEDGVSVGMTRTQLENVRGAPAQRSGGEYVYNLGGALPTMLHVGFEGERVSRLEWRFPID